MEITYKNGCHNDKLSYEFKLKTIKTVFNVLYTSNCKVSYLVNIGNVIFYLRKNDIKFSDFLKQLYKDTHFDNRNVAVQFSITDQMSAEHVLKNCKCLTYDKLLTGYGENYVYYFTVLIPNAYNSYGEIAYENLNKNNSKIINNLKKCNLNVNDKTVIMNLLNG